MQNLKAPVCSRDFLFLHHYLPQYCPLLFSVFAFQCLHNLFKGLCKLSFIIIYCRTLIRQIKSNLRCRILRIILLIVVRSPPVEQVFVFFHRYLFSHLPRPMSVSFYYYYILSIYHWIRASAQILLDISFFCAVRLVLLGCRALLFLDYWLQAWLNGLIHRCII